MADLIPIRYGRMLTSPFAFFRGAALIMADDLSTTPTTPIHTQLCGDAHLSNFGAYASAERRLVFDINDFDETHPGPFEWDVKRLAASFVVAGRENGLSDNECRDVVLAGVGRYRMAMRQFAKEPILSVWYAFLDADKALAEYRESLTRAKRKAKETDLGSAERLLAKARTRDRLQAVKKLTEVVDGRRRIVSNPPLVVPLADLTGMEHETVMEEIRGMLDAYRATVRYDRRRLFDHYQLVDVAHKVVGVGSVGLRAWILLLEGGVSTEGLVLQAKQAGESVLAPYVGPSEYDNHGERVVAGQLMMQSSSDIFLGWLGAGANGAVPDDYYLRQLRDWKISADIEKMSPSSMMNYASLCGWTLAKAHARAGDRIKISAYLGKSHVFEEAVADFARSYADQNQRDYDALAAAVREGRITVEFGL